MKRVKRLLTVAELADEMRVHIRTVYGWIYRGLIKAERYSRGKMKSYRICPKEAKRIKQVVKKNEPLERL